MHPRIWATSADGLLQYVSLTQNKMKEVLHLVRTCYFKGESLSKSIDLPNYPQAVEELDQLTLKAAKDGVSLVAMEKVTGKVVGFVINKINVKEDHNGSFFDSVNVTHPAAKAYLQVNAEIDKAINIFDLLKTNCYFEPLFISNLPEVRRTGICKNLFNLSVRLARHLKIKENIKVGLDDKPLALEPIPQIVCGIATSDQSKKLSQSVGFVEVAKIDLSKNESLKALLKTKISPVYVCVHYL